MKDSFHPGASLLSKVFLLTRPFGNGKLAFVFLLSLLQGLFLGVGVSSIFPFLAVAADPAGIRESRIGLEFLGLVPEMSDQHLLLLAGAVSLTALLLSNAMSFLADYARARYASSYGHWLQVRLLREILRQPWPYFLQRNASVLAKKVGSDAAQFVSGVVIPLLDFAARAFTVMFLLALLVAMQPAIALTVGAVLCVFYLLVFRLLAEVRRRVSAGLLESGREGSKVLYDILCGVKVLKMHRSENAFLENFAEPSARSARLLTLSPLLAGGPRYVLEPVVFGCLILAVLIFSRGGQDLVAMLPTLGVVALAVYRLIPAMQLLYSNATTVHTNRHSVSEVYEEFVASNLARNGEESEKLRPQWESAFVLQSELTLDSIRFRYPEAKNEVLRGVSAVIQRNEAVALVGETGAGKSTLVDLVLGLHRPSAGRILLDGKGLTQEEAPRWQSAIGYVPQEVFLFDDTISRNIAIGVPESEIDPARLLEVAEIAQIRRFIEEETGEGFSTRVGDRGVKLSGGQRQRLGLARALYHCPQVLVLDEATSALDGATENAVIAAIERLRHSLMIIVVAHRLSTIRHCDRVLRLEGGVLSECPDPRRACA